MNIDIKGEAIEKFLEHYMGKLCIAFVLFIIPEIFEIWIHPIPNNLWWIKVSFKIISIVIACLGIKNDPPLFGKEKVEEEQQREIKKKRIWYVVIFLVYLFGIYSLLRDYDILPPISPDKVTKSTITVPMVPAITSTPIYKTIQDLPVCNSEDKNFPCRYLTLGENQKDIANVFYSYRTELVGRIMELYRDESGTIPVFKENKLIIIPEDYREQDLDYYEFYFRLLDPPIFQCQYINSPPTPCWYISKGESYKELANGYPTVIKESCIPGANKTEWSKTEDGLVPKTIESGKMIMLPVCP